MPVDTIQWSGSQIEFALVSDHVEMRVRSAPSEMTESGFGMFKSRRPAVPADFGVATLQKKLFDPTVASLQSTDIRYTKYSYFYILSEG